jgi:glycosyltransferase involved in cell wall biosynthesis
VHGPYSVNRYSRIMTRGERVIAISDFIREYILGNYPGVPAGRIVTIPRGVDPQQFPYGHRPSQEWLADWHGQQPQLRDRFLACLPARITRWKGQADFLDIISGLRRRGLPVHGLLAGGAEPRRQRFLRQLRQQVADQGLADCISFLGHRSDLREIMSVSDVVFSLAREPEAFGRTALEALSLGVPVIAYDHGGASEVLGAMFPDGRVPVGDTGAAAARAAAFYETPPVVPDHNPYTLQRMLDATLALYRDVAGPG